MIAPRSCYKYGLIKIPDIEIDDEPNGNLIGNGVKLDNFREAYERDVLIKCLGYSEYKLFQDNLEVVSGASVQTVKSSADQKWKDLFSGKDYTIDGVDMHWDGLLFKEGVYDKSLIAYYVYYHFLIDDMSNYTGTGLQSENSKNSEKVSIIPKAAKAWRQFHEMTVGCYGGPTQIFEGSVLIGVDYFGSDNGVRSLYQFINDMNVLDPTAFPKWNPKLFDNVNQFGI